ncbi:MAG TPA: MATE family efflux transporter [Candidatus Mediterraneibacter faecigallinarum]|uniref:MATE family efflux transporter n=1 Tax=Candidatus Mediterraneibacter faecigallinarum TaxID=2838669 RepID=A0A9D2NX18_9FIRM|nr:MATE family efflux transporter [Candidatus Mediterraneibacter faecigallinarum]
MQEKKQFYKKLAVLVLPIAVQNLMTALVSASDALMLGFLDQSSLSAVSLATQVQFVLNLFYAALTIGSTVLAAQYWGKGDFRSVEKILAAALKSALLISVVFFFAALAVPELLMRIFTSDSGLIRLGAGYLRAVSWSYLFMGISQIYLCIMKNTGRALRSTIYGSTAVVLNIGLNAVLIFGLIGFPQMGTVGAALATTISRAAELILVLMEDRAEARRGEKAVCIRMKYLRKDDPVLRKDFWRYTLPVMGNQMVWGCGFTMFSVIMGHLGNDAVAANSIANIMKNIISCVCLGIGTGSGIIVGNELGSGRLEQAKRYGRMLCHTAFAAGVVSGLVILVSSPLIMNLASALTLQAREYLRFMLYVCSYYMIGKSLNSTVVAGIFCAGGDTKFGFLCDTVVMWVVIVPVGLAAAFVWKLPVLTVYFLLNLDELIKLPAVYRHYRQYRWVRDLTR